jgi:hypothetical protein
MCVRGVEQNLSSLKSSLLYDLIADRFSHRCTEEEQICGKQYGPLTAGMFNHHRFRVEFVQHSLGLLRRLAAHRNGQAGCDPNLGLPDSPIDLGTASCGATSNHHSQTGHHDQEISIANIESMDHYAISRHKAELARRTL